MNRQPLDIYDEYPSDMRRYLSNYGWHFNKRACDFAVGLMKKRDNGKLVKITPWSKDDVERLLKEKNVTLENNTGYDHVYVANMCKADNYGGSVPDDSHLAMYVKESIDDPDAGDGAVMRKWYATMVSAGEIIFWEDFL